MACEYSLLSRRFLLLVEVRGEGCIRRLEVKINIGLTFLLFFPFSFGLFYSLRAIIRNHIHSLVDNRLLHFLKTPVVNYGIKTSNNGFKQFCKIVKPRLFGDRRPPFLSCSNTFESHPQKNQIIFLKLR